MIRMKVVHGLEAMVLKEVENVPLTMGGRTQTLMFFSCEGRTAKSRHRNTNSENHASALAFDLCIAITWPGKEVINRPLCTDKE